ncbi:hypothetical protein B0H14DRAFT_2572797 [Mycena olivaceomarginata]|nr:hypothetical protein B0H14DRAFT_2572797 [Mycena olivaceomarginata]
MGASVCFSFVVSNSGRLHFSACQTGLRPRQRVRIPQSSVATWIFGEHPTILPGHNALVRTGTCSGYTTGATRMPGENQSLRYLEGSMVGGTEIGWFRLPSLPLPKFHIWSGDSGNQTFRTSQNRRYPRPRFPSNGFWKNAASESSAIDSHLPWATKIVLYLLWIYLPELVWIESGKFAPSEDHGVVSVDSLHIPRTEWILL